MGPSRVYEKILLNKEYDKALLEIEECLKFYDPVLIHKCKQKLGKLTQYLIRKYELNKNDKIKLVARRKKAQKIERNRSIKILERMDIEKEIKEELQLRLEENLFGEEIKEKMKENIEN